MYEEVYKKTSVPSEPPSGFALDLERADRLTPLEATTDGLLPSPYCKPFFNQYKFLPML